VCGLFLFCCFVFFFFFLFRYSNFRKKEKDTTTEIETATVSPSLSGGPLSRGTHMVSPSATFATLPQGHIPGKCLVGSSGHKSVNGKREEEMKKVKEAQGKYRREENRSSLGFHLGQYLLS